MLSVTCYISVAVSISAAQNSCHVITWG